jgi:hypothetical protein
MTIAPIDENIAHPPKSNTAMKKFTAMSLVVFLLLFCILGWLNHSALVHSDPNSYLLFARSLSEGNYFVEFPPEKLLIDNVAPGKFQRSLYGRVIKDGRSFQYVAIGYPFFLSLFITVGGIFAPFYVNILVFVGIYIALFFFTGLLFKNHLYSHLTALISVVLYFITNRVSTVFLFRCYRDPLSYLFLLLGFCFYFKFFKSPKRTVYIILAAVCIGLACVVRETSFLCLLPMALLFYVKYLKDKSFKIMRRGAIFILFFIIGCSPLLVQNYVNTGNPLLHTQNMVRRGLSISNKPARKSNARNFVVPGTRLEYFNKTARGYLRILWKQYKWYFTLFFVAGLFYERKRDEIIFFVLPNILLYLLFYCFLGKAPWRYIFVIHMFIAPVIAAGVINILSLKLKPDRQYKIVCLVLLILTTCYMFIPKRPQMFRVNQARKLRSDFEKVVPQNSVVISERLMRANLNYFGNFYCLRLGDLGRFRSPVTADDEINYYLDNIGDVYFFDNLAFCPIPNSRSTSVTRQKILERFNLGHVENFMAKKYELEDLFGKPSCGLWKITRWEEQTARQVIETGEVRDSVLIINARKLWNTDFERSFANVYCNGNRLDNPIGDGVNYIFLPEEYLTVPESVIEIASDAPVPSDFEPQIIGMYDDILLDIGSNAVPLDESLISNVMPNSEFIYKSLTRETKITLPTIAYPDSYLAVALKILLSHKAQSDCVLTVLMDGKVITRTTIEKYSNSKYFGFLINGEDTGGAKAQLSFQVEFVDGRGFKLPDRDTPDWPLLIDKVIVQRKVTNKELLLNTGFDDQAYIKMGAYPAEKHLNEFPVRWTRPTAMYHLPYLSPAKTYLLQIGVYGCAEAAGEKVAAILVNETKIGEMTIVPESLQTFTFSVPSEALSTGSNLLTIKTPGWRPSDTMRSSDKRDLGIMLDSLRLHFN